MQLALKVYAEKDLPWLSRALLCSVFVHMSCLSLLPVISMRFDPVVLAHNPGYLQIELASNHSSTPLLKEHKLLGLLQPQQAQSNSQAKKSVPGLIHVVQSHAKQVRLKHNTVPLDKNGDHFGRNLVVATHESKNISNVSGLEKRDELKSESVVQTDNVSKSIVDISPAAGGSSRAAMPEDLDQFAPHAWATAPNPVSGSAFDPWWPDTAQAIPGVANYMDPTPWIVDAPEMSIETVGIASRWHTPSSDLPVLEIPHLSFSASIIDALPLEGTVAAQNHMHWVDRNAFERAPIKMPMHFDNDSQVAMIEFLNTMYVTNQRIGGGPDYLHPAHDFFFTQGRVHADRALQALQRREVTMRNTGITENNRFAELEGCRMMLYAAKHEWPEAANSFKKFDFLTDHAIERHEYYERFASICYNSRQLDLTLAACRGQLKCYSEKDKSHIPRIAEVKVRIVELTRVPKS